MTSKKINSNTFTALYTMVLQQTQYILAGAGVALVAVSLFLGYTVWMQQKDKSAQNDFGSLMMEYHALVHEKSAERDELLEKFKQGYEKHSGSSLAPYFLAYQARILISQGKHAEALDMLNRVVTQYVGSPLHTAFRMEKDLLALDYANEFEKQAALEDLIALSQDTNNSLKDSALFYLGRYYWATNQLEQARNTWQILVDEQRDEKIAPSPWASQVKNYLSATLV